MLLETNTGLCQLRCSETVHGEGGTSFASYSTVPVRRYSRPARSALACLHVRLRIALIPIRSSRHALFARPGATILAADVMEKFDTAERSTEEDHYSLTSYRQRHGGHQGATGELATLFCSGLRIANFKLARLQTECVHEDAEF